MKKYKILSLILTILIICILPFSLNTIVNLGCFDPTLEKNNIQLQIANEQLVKTFLPEYINMDLTFIKKSSFNWGNYLIYVKSTKHDNYNPNLYTYKNDSHIEIKQGRFINNKNTLAANKNVITEWFNNITDDVMESLWLRIENDKYYYSFFVFNGDVEFKELSDIVISNMIIEKDDKNIIEWIGTSFADSQIMWGLAVGERKNPKYGIDKDLSPALLAENLYKNKFYQLLLSSGLYGDFSSVDFSTIDTKSSKVTAVMMYGKGSELKKYRNNTLLTLAKITPEYV